MTLIEAITLLGTRFDVDLDADIDTGDHEAMATAISDAAKEFTRATYSLFTWRADLTLTVGETEYNLLDPAVCSLPVFECRKVHINAVWLSKLEPVEFETNDTLYFSEANSANPGVWVALAPDLIKIAAPPSAAAVAASDNFVTGYYEHPAFTYALNATSELLGPEQTHRLIVDKAFLNNSKSYFAGSEAANRRAMISGEYVAETGRIRIENLARFKPARRRGGAGNVRRIIGIDSGGGIR